jgi:hypothetical protein
MPRRRMTPIWLGTTGRRQLEILQKQQQRSLNALPHEGEYTSSDLRNGADGSFKDGEHALEQREEDVYNARDDPEDGMDEVVDG